MVISTGLVFLLALAGITGSEANKNDRHQWGKRQLTPKSSKSSGTKQRHYGIPGNLFHTVEDDDSSSKKRKKKSWYYYRNSPAPSGLFAGDETVAPTKSPTRKDQPSILPPTMIIPTFPQDFPTTPISVIGPTIILSPTLFTSPSAPQSTEIPTTLMLVDSPTTEMPVRATTQPTTWMDSRPTIPEVLEPVTIAPVSEKPTIAPIKAAGSCTLTNGVYGEDEADMTEDISFLYQIETKTGPGSEMTRQLSMLEDTLTEALIPMLFPGACDVERRRRRHLMAEVVGITSNPPDLVVVDKTCQPFLSPSNLCFVVDGRFRVFSDGTDAPAHLKPVLNAKLRTEMAQGTFNRATDGILRVSTYTEQNPIMPSDPSSPSDSSKDPINKSMIGAMVGVFGTTGLLLGVLALRQFGIRRSQQQGEAILRSRISRS